MAYTTINKSTEHFNTKLYTGNSGTNAQTAVDFQPDITWIKTRSHSGYNHVAVDAVRGVTKEIRPNLNTAEITTTNSFTSFDSDGFTLGADSGDNYNKTGNTYCAWNWKAGGTGSANTDGSDNSTVSVNTTAGISIVKWTPSGSNATVGHGLGAVPECMLSFRLGGAQDRFVYHKDIGNTKYVRLNQTTASTTDANAWNNTTPTSSVFSVGSQFGGSDSVQYCFTSVKGFSKIGSYTGNGNADGTFIYTGFKPAWVLIKDSGRTESWYIFDNRRLGYNGGMADLIANSTAAESSSSATLLDLVSNGFKLRGTTDHLNGSGQNFIFMAFAEAPLVGSNNVPATAR